MMRRYGVLAAGAGVLLIVLTGCAGLDVAVGGLADVGEAFGLIDSDTADALELAGTGLETLANVVDAASSPFTPEQEYYVGRSVAATILSSNDPVENPKLVSYVNLLGQTLALASGRPYIYHGYTFEVLDSDEINAFASPGGHIFVTTGMIDLTRSEDELAAILAHEIGHVVERHGLGSIRTSRVISAVQEGMFDALSTVTPAELEEVTGVFGDATSDVLDTLVTRGYSGATEREADGLAVGILLRVGYDPYALIRVLERMDAAQAAEYEGSSDPRGFSKTHPRPELRIADLRRTELRDIEPGSRINEAAAQRRYREALGRR